MDSRPSNQYFLIAVSNKTNVDLCIKHVLAGFPGTLPGVWAFSDIDEGDFISFLYGAKVFNLYRVKLKFAIRNAERAGPWPPVTFRMWNKTYYFPFRLQLEPVRQLEESLVRMEFEYVGENLLLRGGYRKTHFQADHLTLLNVTNLGSIYEREHQILTNDSEEFQPQFVSKSTLQNPPESFATREVIVQSIVRHYFLKKSNLKDFIEKLGLSLDFDELEVLGEKALQEGIVDILIKEKLTVPSCRKIVIEVKNNIASANDVDQTKAYANTLGKECLAGCLIARGFQKKAVIRAMDQNIRLFKFSIEANSDQPRSFTQMIDDFRIVKVEEV